MTSRLSTSRSLSLLTLLVNLSVASDVSAKLVSPDGTGKLPALGWNTWNEYECNINESVILDTAQLMVDLGLKDAGYEYINIDDCWSDKAIRRDPDTGRIVPDFVKFPRGISYVADKVHELGLKLGIYSDAGTLTCAKYEGSLGFEDIDAETWADWGIDYLKYDNCNVPREWYDEYDYYPENPNANPPPPGYDYATSKTAERYNRMRDALLKQDRTIQYSMCAWGHAHIERWGNQTGHSWRMYGDIAPEWGGDISIYWGVLPITQQAASYWNYTGFWAHNDWDMLEVGNGQLTLTESRTHFALWAALKSPLIIGTKLVGISDEILAVLSNRELIAFNQDPTVGESACPFGLTEPVQPASKTAVANPPVYWVGTSQLGFHVFLLNTQDEREMGITFADVPGLRTADAKFLVHDMWTGEDLGVFEDSFSLTVARHDTAALRFTTVDGEHPNSEWNPGKWCE